MYLILNVHAGSLTFFGWEGWRFVFLSVALVSISIGVLNWVQARDPNFPLEGSVKTSQAAAPSLKEVWREMKAVMSIPTFLIIVIQVILLMIPLVFAAVFMRPRGSKTCVSQGHSIHRCMQHSISEVDKLKASKICYLTQTWT